MPDFVCIHGHFYQPPRENPWLGAVERQFSAHHYHDWNERVTRECYGPNIRARLLDEEGKINKIINNFEYMSHNVGPTLLAWLADRNPYVYQNIIAADRASAARFGHGSALAQVYNHVIMPLASRRDKLTQIRWGIADFTHRYGRAPEGMWLAETAADEKTLRLLAAEGISFTILSPDQAARVRPLGAPSSAWRDVRVGKIDTTRPYRLVCDRSTGAGLDLFFYNKPLSQAIAFEGLLGSGAGFLARIEAELSTAEAGPARLVNIATDGESYGHHFKFGEMALAWALDRLSGGDGLKLCNYSEFLRISPPDQEARMVDPSSWSCAHGVERWRADCGCSVGHDPAWNQAWRAPLRQGMDRLSQALDEIFEREGGGIMRDPWAMRDGYVQVLLKPESWRDFCADHLRGRAGGAKDRDLAWRLLESQRMRLFMFTSCAWFFDDISSLEPIQNMKYAARAIELVQGLEGAQGLEAELLETLATAKSNIPDKGSGRDLYHKRAVSARMGFLDMAANAALASLAASDGRMHPLFDKRLAWERQKDNDGLVKIGLGASLGLEKESKKLVAVCAVRGPENEDIVGYSSEITEDFSFDALDAALAGKTAQEVERAFTERLPDAHRVEVKYACDDVRYDLLGFLAQELEGRIHRLSAPYFRLRKGLEIDLEALSEPLPEGRIAPACAFPDAPLDEFWIAALTSCNINEYLDVAEKKAHENGPTQDMERAQKLAQCALECAMKNVSTSCTGESCRWFIRLLHFAKHLGLAPDLWMCQNLALDLTNYMAKDTDFNEQFLMLKNLIHLSEINND